MIEVHGIQHAKHVIIMHVVFADRLESEQSIQLLELIVSACMPLLACVYNCCTMYVLLPVDTCNYARTNLFSHRHSCIACLSNSLWHSTLCPLIREGTSSSRFCNCSVPYFRTSPLKVKVAFLQCLSSVLPSQNPRRGVSSIACRTRMIPTELVLSSCC